MKKILILLAMALMCCTSCQTVGSGPCAGTYYETDGTAT